MIMPSEFFFYICIIIFRVCLSVVDFFFSLLSSFAGVENGCTMMHLDKKKRRRVATQNLQYTNMLNEWNEWHTRYSSILFISRKSLHVSCGIFLYHHCHIDAIITIGCIYIVFKCPGASKEFFLVSFHPHSRLNY